MAKSNYIVRGGYDASGITKGIAQTQTQLKSFQSNINNTMGKIKSAIIGIGIGKLVKDATGAAMQYESSLQQIGRIMGQNSNEFNSWANTQAKAFGMAKSEASKYGAVYGNLISGFAKDTADTTKYTIDLLKASAVVSSGTGRTMEDVMDRIRSGLLGNTEAIEDLGINVNVAMIESTEAFKKFANGKSWKQLDYQTQQTIRYFAIMEQASKKYGDSVNQNTATNQQKFIAELKNVQLSLGQAFLPIYNTILPALTSLASKLSYVASIATQFSQALFGKGQQQTQTKGTVQQANAVSDLGDAYQDAGKEAKGALAGFDEVNSVSNNSGGESTGNPVTAAGSVGPETTDINFETNAPEISEKIQVMADTVRSKIQSVWDVIIANKETIISVVGGIIAGFATFETLTFLTQLPIILGAIGTGLSLLLSPIGIAAIAIGSLVAIFLDLYQTNEQFRNDINTIWGDIAKTFQDFWDNTLNPIGQYIINDFISPIAEAFQANIVPVLKEMFIGASMIFKSLLDIVISTISNIWNTIRPGMDLIKTIIIDALEIIKSIWDKYGQTLIDNVVAFIQGLQETFQLIWDNIINPIIQPALEMLTSLWEKHLKGLVEQVAEFVMKCVNGALELWNGFIKPIIDWLLIQLGPVVKEVMTSIVGVFDSFFISISDVVKGVVRILGGLVDFIVGVFTGNWKKAWEGVKDIFGGIFDSLVGLVKLPLNLIIDAVNAMIRGLNSISIDIPDWVPGGFGGKTFGINIPQIPKLAKGGIIDNPTIAMIGEKGPEAVVPLENTGFVDSIASAVGTAVLSAMQMVSNNTGGNGSREIVMEWNGNRFAKFLLPEIDSEIQRMGYKSIFQNA